ncbi:MAG: hypothetical protein AB1792_08560 [Candidatus Zixiibacteriota bacterium]
MHKATRVLLVVAFAIGIMPILQGGLGPSPRNAMPGDPTGSMPASGLSAADTGSIGPVQSVVSADSLEYHKRMGEAYLSVRSIPNPADVSDWDKLRILFR